MDQLIGKYFGKRYEILERIGSGGMAVVYKAKCHWLNRFVAIKILKDDLAQDEEFRRRFHEESQAVAMLSHPNIVSIYDVSRAEETSEPDYIVMELIEGITLKQYMQKRGGQLSWKESLHFITQIMKGLSHAHSRGIIHRDIKPHNIMVLRDGSVKVADFGIARLMSNAQSTMTQEALGSVHYISPEQARGSRIDARSDIYSAGVVLYEMLTGRLPYEGDSPVAVAIQHINSIPLSPREIDPSIPEALEEITMKAMAPDPNKRYLTADAMLVDLEEFRKNPNINFDYTSEDLMVDEGDEPTQPIGANPPQIVNLRSLHTGGRKEESPKKVKGEESEDDYDYDDDDRGGIRSVIIVVVLVTVCLVGVGTFLWNNVFSGMMETGETVAVPKVVGYTVEEARALPEVSEKNFIIVEGREVESDEVPEGHIISQSPEADAMVKAGAHEITVEISVGKSGLKMPDCYQQDQRIASRTLRSMGLEVEVQEDYSEDITSGMVMSQDPAPEQPVEKGDKVTITVSKGPEPKPKTMISVTGVSLEEATRMLTDMGLRVGKVTSMPSEEIAEGLVCYQSVEINITVFEGATIDLGISTGAEVVEPPDTSPSQTPTETESPEPTPPDASTRRKEGTVDLPNDRSTVIVRVTVDGVEKYKENFNTTLRRARYTIEGSGVQEVVVYIDDVEVKRYTEDFSN